MKNFAITGIAGYIAPRHLKAIKDTGNRLVAALDPHDSVGILDGYFNDVDFFTDPERFDRHLEKLRRKETSQAVDYLSICSPNHLHDAHIRMALRTGAHAICEKPLVLNPWNLDLLSEIESETGKKIYNVLQLRLHPSIIALKKKFAQSQEKCKINLTYITSRGKWYLYSWKGNLEKSGGLVTNIGIHFFDMLIWVFGDVEKNEVHFKDSQTASGFLTLERAEIQWFLSIDKENLPEHCQSKGQRTYRSISIEESEIEFSGGFTDLHTEVYKGILAGNGYGIQDAAPSIKVAHQIRKTEATGVKKYSHPFLISK